MKLVDVIKKLEYCELIRISVNKGDDVDILTDWIYPEDVSNVLYDRQVLKMGVYKARTTDETICNGGLWIVLEEGD